MAEFAPCPRNGSIEWQASPSSVTRPLLQRGNAAPGDDAGELGLVRPEEALADARMHAVGADQHVAFDGFSTFKLERDCSLVLLEAHALGAETDRFGIRAPHCALEH